MVNKEPKVVFVMKIFLRIIEKPKPINRILIIHKFSII